MAELWARELKKKVYTQKLNVDVAAGDYEAWISPYGNYVAYIVRHSLTQQGGKDIYQKMHRTVFSFSDGSKISEENIESPALLPLIPEGKSIPADPLAFLFSSYLKEIPDPPAPQVKPTKCQRSFWGKPFYIWYESGKKIAYIDPNQRIAIAGTPIGTPAQEEDRKLIKWVLQNDCKGELAAKWKETPLTDKTNDSNEAICEQGTSKESSIELNKLDIPNEELKFTKIVTMGIYQK